MRLKLLERKFVLIVVEVFNFNFGNTQMVSSNLFFFAPNPVIKNSFSKKKIANILSGRSFVYLGSWVILSVVSLTILGPQVQ